MPIYEYYCQDNHTIYQFYAKTLAQGKMVPKCPANPRFRMEKLLSSFAVTSGKAETTSAGEAPSKVGADRDPREEAAMNALEKDFSRFDDDDPKAMGRMMRRMAELGGEKMDGQVEEVVRKLEEGADPESLEEQLGGEAPCHMEDPDAPAGTELTAKEKRHRFRSQTGPTRDPQLYDYK